MFSEPNEEPYDILSVDKREFNYSKNFQTKLQKSYRHKLLKKKNGKFVSLSKVDSFLSICPVRNSTDGKYKFENYDCVHVEKFINVLSVVLLTKHWTISRIKIIVERILEYYNVDIFIAVFGEEKINFNKNKKNIKYFYFTEMETVGSALKQIVPKIRTPFTFITYTLSDYINKYAPLEQLVTALENQKEVGVASGSARDPMGAWDHGCLQRTSKNYYIVYSKGYMYSKNGCMYCDDVLNPFVTKTNLLRNVDFSEEFDGEALFYDWFMRVSLEGREIISCLHIMFFTANTRPISRADWRSLATKWKIQDIKTYDDISYHFTCPEVGINCYFIREKVAYYIAPPCCIEYRTRELEYVTSCADKLGIDYQLWAGSLMGPVKLDDFLLWDFDNDVRIHCSHLKQFLSKGKECIHDKGCGLYRVTDSYSIVKCPLADIDVTCRSNITEYLTQDHQSIHTTIVAHGRKWKVRPNPGLATIQDYGPDYLRHLVHWRYHSEDTKGFWTPCKTPDSHTCLDQLPSDGSIPFKRPFPLVLNEPIIK